MSTYKTILQHNVVSMCTLRQASTTFNFLLLKYMLMLKTNLPLESMLVKQILINLY